MAELTLDKILLTGVNTLSTRDIKAYVHEHFDQAHLFEHAEWVDDSAVKLVFDTEDAAARFLSQISEYQDDDDKHVLFAAAPYSPNPDIDLSARFATTEDQKQRGNAIYSEYYVDHPEHAPFNRGHKIRGRARESFDVDLYDDDPEAVSRARSRSRSPVREQRRASHRERSPHRHPRNRRSDIELLPNKVSRGRLTDNDDNSLSYRKPSTARRPRDRSQIELFPEKVARSRLARATDEENYAGAKAVRELFPHKVRRGKEDSLAEQLGDYQLDGAY